jgi:hypothetical protein
VKSTHIVLTHEVKAFKFFNLPTEKLYNYGDENFDGQFGEYVDG